MAKVTCAISGISFNCDHLPITLYPVDGYFHPIFAVPYKTLYSLYAKHCSNHLTSTDSYLLFLAFLHSTDQIEWAVPASLQPTTPTCTHLVETNLRPLIEVIELTNVIGLPSFKQPSYKVTIDNSDLSNIPAFISAWNRNISIFKAGAIDERIRDSLRKVENKLTYAIKSGNSLDSYSHIVASWADKVAGFPIATRERWCKIIRSCFNEAKMFSTPLAELKEVRDYCTENIEAGSIHFHALMKVLRTGISKHTDYLGMNPIALGYTLLPTDSTQNDAKLATILASAPTATPQQKDYGSQLAYIRAKLAYRSAQIEAKRATPTITTDAGEEL